MSGTNAHVIIEEAPVQQAKSSVVDGPLPVVVSGRDQAALREQAGVSVKDTSVRLALPARATSAASSAAA